MLKRSFRSTGEVAVTRANSEDQVCFPRQNVRAWRARDANGADILRMVKRQRSFAGLSLAHGNSRSFRKPRKHLRRFRIENAATCDDQRYPRLAYPAGSAYQKFVITSAARNLPHSLLQEFIRKIESLSLHILR